MLNNIRDLELDISINNILHENSDFAYDVNCSLLTAVHRYILDTKRFVQCLCTSNSSDGNDSISIAINLAILCHFSQIIMNEMMLCFCNILSN